MRSRRRTPLAALLASLFLWLALAQPGIARAEDTPEAGPPPEAKKAFADGKAAFERGEYDNALQLFHRAALIAPAPSLYYNIGMAYERLARYEDSAIAFEKYLQLIEAPQTEEDRTFQANLRARATANRTRASRPVNAMIRPSTGASSAVTSARETRCRFGISIKCTAVSGLMSWKARISSSS